MVTYIDQKEVRLRTDIREDIKAAVEMMASTIALAQSKDRQSDLAQRKLDRRWMIGTMLAVIALLISALGFVVTKLS